jgi:tetratricopeptide (TPR) repeat protein
MLTFVRMLSFAVMIGLSIWLTVPLAESPQCRGTTRTQSLLAESKRSYLFRRQPFRCLRLSAREVELDIDWGARVKPKLPEAFLFWKKGDLAYCKGNFDDASVWYDRAIASCPTYAIAYMRRGLLRAERHDARGALSDYARALSLDSENYWIYLRRADLLQSVGENREAIADASRVLRFYPKSQTALLVRGLAWTDIGDQRQALRDLNRVVELYPHDAWVYNVRGSGFESMGLLICALKDYTTAIALDSKYAQALRNRSHAWQILGNHKEQMRDLDRVIQIEPTAMNFDLRGNERYAMNDLFGAVEDYSQEIRCSPIKSIGYRRRGETRLYLDDFCGAIEDFDSILRLEDPDSYILNRRAFARRMVGDFAGALGDEARSIWLDPRVAYYDVLNWLYDPTWTMNVRAD